MAMFIKRHYLWVPLIYLREIPEKRKNVLFKIIIFYILLVAKCKLLMHKIPVSNQGKKKEFLQ